MTSRTTPWSKKPSVSPGDKAYFWTRELSGTRYWVVWDRQKRKWSVDTHSKEGIAFFTTPEAGKRFVDNKE